MHFASLFSLLLPVLSFFPSIHAWDCSLLFQQELQGQGLTQLAALFSTINQTTTGQDLLSKISLGNLTFFAPTDEALKNVSSQVSSNSTLFAEYLAYHFVHGNFQNVSSSSNQSSPTSSTSASSSTESSSTTESSTSGTSTPTAAAAASLLGRIFRRRTNRLGSSTPELESGIFPNTTVGRTLLNSSELVHLPGNNSQVLAWTKFDENSNVTILNQVNSFNSSQNITVINSTVWGSIFINQINGVLIPPGNISTALNATNATSLLNFLGTVQIPSANGTNVTATEFLQEADGITFFAPNNAAIESVNQTIVTLQSNVTALTAVLQNHYINGTVLYSPEIQLLGQNSSSSSSNFSSPLNSTRTATNATSAAGEPLQFVSNSSGTFVESNGLSAKIVQPDVLIDNGVIHIIDTVLLNNASDPAAASSAFSAATSSAASITTETGPIGVATSTSSTSSESSSSTSESSASTTSSSETSTSGSSTATATTTS